VPNRVAIDYTPDPNDPNPDLRENTEGKIVFAGWTGMPGTYSDAYGARALGDFVARFYSDGSPDTSYGGGPPLQPAAVQTDPDHPILDTGTPGVAFIPAINGRDNRTSSYVGGIAQQPDGKILLVGTSGYSTTLTRLTTDGHVDQNFAPLTSNP